MPQAELPDYVSQQRIDAKVSDPCFDLGQRSGSTFSPTLLVVNLEKKRVPSSPDLIALHKPSTESGFVGKSETRVLYPTSAVNQDPANYLHGLLTASDVASLTIDD